MELVSQLSPELARADSREQFVENYVATRCVRSEAFDAKDQLQSDRSGAGGETMVRGVRAN